MELTANPHWGMLARRGFFELSAHNATLLRRAGIGPGARTRHSLQVA